MASAAIELQKAIFAALSSSEDLTSLLGTVRIYDHAPANAAFPYLTFGRTTGFDWSTSTEVGSEHLVTLHAWSKARGKQETMQVIETVRGMLHDAELDLDGHRLVNIRVEYEEVRFDEDLDVYHGMARLRAVTEAIA